MIPSLSRHIAAIVIFLAMSPVLVAGQQKTRAHICGSLSLEPTWARVVYLSYIPTFDEMYAVSNEMIIARTPVDSLGYFSFDIDFLPKGENLYRLHVVKKGDTPASLIIGGKDENHLFLIADRFSDIRLRASSSCPPFKKVRFEHSAANAAFQKVSDLVFVADSLASESSASKRLLVETQLQKDLHAVADTSRNFLVSLYAVYASKFESNYASHLVFYKNYLKKWKEQDNAYYLTFARKLPVETRSNLLPVIIFLVLIAILTALMRWKHLPGKTMPLEKLSIQERKIYELLQQGASNQEISNHFNIGLSTVKSHVSSIYSKLNIKSRKHIIKS